MSRLVLDSQAIKLINLFQTLTRANIKDCINQANKIIFVVQPGEIAKAIGSKGINVKNLERALKKRVKITEFSQDCKTFISNLIHPLKVSDIEEKEGIFTLKSEDSKTRGALIGKVGSNLRDLEEVIKRYFDIKKLRVTQN